VTTQIKDVCRYLGSEYKMPVYLAFPVDGERIRELDPIEFAKDESNAILTSTACWRNYVATWEITEGRLFLVQFEGKFQVVENQPLFADWFSGEFELPQGALLDCNIELDFTLKYEKSVMLKFVDGILIQSTLSESA